MTVIANTAAKGSRLARFCEFLERKVLGSNFLPVTFCAFLLVRLALILLIPGPDPSSDAAWYFNRAVTMLTGGTYSEGGYPTAYWPVGYPGFLRIVFGFLGPSIWAAQLANLALAGLSFWLLYFFARRSLHSETAARGSVLLLTCYPNNAAYVALLLTETLFVFLLLAATAGLMLKRDGGRIAVAGIMFGLATLVKAQTVVFVPIVAFLAFLSSWSWKSVGPALGRTAVVIAISALLVAPWTLRNYQVFHKFVPVSTNGGVSLLAGNNPSVAADFRHDYSDNDPLFNDVHRSVQDQVNADRRAKAIAIQWIASNPLIFASLAPKKVFRLWAPDGEAEWAYQGGAFYQEHACLFRIVRVANQIFYLAALAALLFAIHRLLRARAPPAAFIGLGVIVMITLVSIIFSGQSRYHFPAMPFIFAYSAWLLANRPAGIANRE